MSERFEMRVTPKWMAMLDAWRAKQRPIPSRTAVLRQAAVDFCEKQPMPSDLPEKDEPR